MEAGEIDYKRDFTDEEFELFKPLFAKFLRENYKACFTQEVLKSVNLFDLKDIIKRHFGEIVETLGWDSREMEELQEEVSELKKEVRSLEHDVEYRDRILDNSFLISNNAPTLYDQLKVAAISEILNVVSLDEITEVVSAIKLKKNMF